MRSVLILSATVLVACGLPVLAVQPAAAVPPGCAAGLESDFNGDGFSDAVVGDPYATVSGLAEAGRVVVLYGDNDGRIGEGLRDVVSQGTDNVAGSPEAGDRFGFALATADLNCDDNTDLVVGTPYEDVGGQADAGYVQIIWGSAGGLGTGNGSTQYDQDDFVADGIRSGNQFGYAVDALEDVEQDGAESPNAFILAIGAPGTDVGGDVDAGWVATVAPLGDGIFMDQLTQDSAGIPGSTESGDRFGASLSMNYLLGDPLLADLAVGSPNEDVGDVVDAGTVTIVRDLLEGSDGAVLYDQDSAGVASLPESEDRFGYSLDSMRTAGGTSRLAVGVPYEDIGADASAGLVQLFSGNGNTLTAGAGLSQDTDGVANETETGDVFGYQVAWARPGLGDTVSRLAVSAPSEDGTANNTGLVQVFPLSDLAAERSYAQSSPGIPGDAEAGDRFGASLAVVAGTAERALLVGVPDDVANSAGMVNVIPFGDGARRAWIPDVGGIPAGASRFGYSLASSG